MPFWLKRGAGSDRGYVAELLRAPTWAAVTDRVQREKPGPMSIRTLT